MEQRSVAMSDELHFGQRPNAAHTYMNNTGNTEQVPFINKVKVSVPNLAHQLHQ